MTTKAIFLCFFMSASLMGFSQENWDKKIKENPRTVIKEAVTLLRTAKEKGDSPLLIKAVLLKSKAELQINHSAYPEVIANVEEVLNETEKPEERAILNFILMDLYSSYYLSNSWQIGRRSVIRDYIPENREEWSANIFYDTIISYSKAALKDPETLLNISMKDYSFLIADHDARFQQLDFIDFITLSVIEKLIRLDDLSSPYEMGKKQSTENLLLPLNTFLNIDWSGDEKLSNLILGFFQQILRIDKNKEGNRALLTNDMRRLKYELNLYNRHSENRGDSLYVVRLQELKQKYNRDTLVVEVILELANHYMSDSQNDQNYLKAYRLVNEGLKKYPGHSKSPDLQKIKTTIEKPGIEMRVEGQIYPGNLELKTSYYHLEKLHLEIFQISETTKEYYEKMELKTKQEKKRIFSKNLSFKKELLLKDTTINIPDIQSGIYEIVLTGAGISTLKREFMVSPFHLSYKKSGKVIEFMVRDLMSGIPLKDITLSIYSKKEKGRYQLLKELTTDRQGFASYSAGNQDNSRITFWVEATSEKIKTGYMKQVYLYDFEEETQYSSITLFTDRKIYKPGENVYFKGIAFGVNREKNYPESGKNMTVTLEDENEETIATEKFKTNSWGSFNGKFTLPSDVMNGEFQININGKFVEDVRVEEYKVPGFEITMDTLKTQYRHGDSIALKGNVHSYAGVALANTRIIYNIRTITYGPWRNRPSTVIGGETTTDFNGDFTIKFGSIIPDQTRDFWGVNYIIEINATDDKGESQSYTHHVSVGRSPYNISTDIPENVDKKKDQFFHIRATNRDQFSLHKKLSYEILQLKPLKNISEQYNTDSLPVLRAVEKGDVTTSDSIKPDFRDWESGAYVIDIYEEDNGVRVNEYKQVFYLYSTEDKRPPYKTNLWFVTEKDTYKTGEEVKILLGTSWQNAHVLYEVSDGNNIIFRESLTLSDEIKQQEFIYNEEFSNEILIQISFVKDKNYYSTQKTLYKKLPDKELQITTTVFRDKMLPGQSETWEFKVQDKSGALLSQDNKAEITAVMYDKALDVIYPNQWRFSPSPYIASYGLYWNNLPGYGFGLYSYSLPHSKSFTATFAESPVFGLANARSMGSDPNQLSEISITGRGSVERMDKAVEDDAALPTIPFRLRENFNETAFFYPSLLTGDDGGFTLKFTIPDAVTTWKLMILAHTQDLRHGYLEKEIVTSKPVMITPNIPRFFREGDEAIVKALVNNTTDRVITGEAVMELFNPGSDQIVIRKQINFTCNAKENKTVSFAFKVPEGYTSIGCRMTAHAGDFSDGEQHLVLVAPKEILLTETIPFTFSGKGKKNYTFTPSATKRKDQRLVLEISSNPIWYAVSAIPTLQDANSHDVLTLSAGFYSNAVNWVMIKSNPVIEKTLKSWKAGDTHLQEGLLRNEELKTIAAELTPWRNDVTDAAGRMVALKEFFNENRVLDLQGEITRKLFDLQASDGSWSWYKGMPGSRFITCNVLVNTIRASLGGEKMITPAIKEAQFKALRYLDLSIKEKFEKDKEKSRSVTYDDLIYLYTRSFFRDVPLTEALAAHKYYINSLQNNWNALSLYEKALAAIALHRYGFHEVALRILASIEEYSVTGDHQEKYWPNIRSSAFYINSAILQHTAIMEAYQEIMNDVADIEGMKLWLLQQKRTQDWGEVPSTVNAIHALVNDQNYLVDNSDKPAIKWGNKKVNIDKADELTGYIKKSVSGNEIRPGMFRLSVDKKRETTSWGAMYLQYLTPLSEVQKSDHPDLSITKSIFIEENSGSGKQLVPVSGNLTIGQKVVVRLVITTEYDLEYVHLQDLRAACFEPVDQLSGMQWSNQLTYYRENKNTLTNFFINYLPKGTHIIEYPVWVNQTGSYQEGVATIQCLFAPEYTAHSGVRMVEVESEK